MKAIYFTISRITAFIVIAALTYLFLFNCTRPNLFDKNSILSSLISVISIIIAIIITFLFSKLFAEKSIRIERKKEIDDLAKKLTYLRRIAFHIKSMNEFWNFKDVNIKSILDNQYKTLTYEIYRGNGKEKLQYAELEKISEEIYGTDGQSYLALKGLEDGENSYGFFSEFNPKNYSAKDIIRYREYANSFWYLLDRSDDGIVNFNRVNKYHLNFIDELYYKIFGRPINNKDYKQSIKLCFEYFESEIFDKLLYLTTMNSNYFPRALKRSFFNLLVFLFLLIFTVFTLIITLNIFWAFVLSLIIISLFIANTIDLIIITFNSIRNELNVNEIFKV